MPEYKKSEAKERTKEKFRGIENVLMPSFKPVKIGEGPYYQIVPEAAMKLYWELTSLRNAFEEFVMPTVAMSNYNLMHWKYMGWLTGMNGGPLSFLTARLYEHEKTRFQAALQQCGITPRELDEEFYVSRVNYRGKGELRE